MTIHKKEHCLCRWIFSVKEPGRTWWCTHIYLAAQGMATIKKYISLKSYHYYLLCSKSNNHCHCHSKAGSHINYPTHSKLWGPSLDFYRTKNFDAQCSEYCNDESTWSPGVWLYTRRSKMWWEEKLRNSVMPVPWFTLLSLLWIVNDT